MPLPPRPQPPDDTVRLIITGTAQTHPWAAIQWLSVTASSRALADLQSIVDGVSGAWHTNFSPQYPAQVSLSEVQGVWKTPGGGELIAQNSTVHVGSLSATIIDDASAAFVLSWHLNAYYRGGHPRTYLPGPYTAAVSNGSDIVPAYASSLQASALAYLNAVNALTHGSISAVVLGTVSFVHDKEWRVPPIFRPYTGVSVSNKLGTQRRRIGR